MSCWAQFAHANDPCLYNILTLTATDNSNGNFSFDLDIDVSSSAYNSLTNIEWDFGDFTIVNNLSQAISHQYYYTSSTTFTITATCTFSNGSSSIDCETTVQVSVPDEQPIPPCPIASFRTPTNCPAGGTTFTWTFCDDIDYDNDGNPDYYWTAGAVQWNFGDGTTSTSTGTNSISHTYTSAATVNVTGIVQFTGANGEICNVSIANINGYMSPCNLVSDPTIPHTFYDEYDPEIADPSLYVSSATLDFCSTDQFSIYNSGEILPTPANYSNWSYALIIDGDSVTSGSGIPTNASPIYQSYLNAGDYTIEIIYTYSDSIDSCSASYSMLLTIDSCEVACDNCSSFKPYPNERFWLSAWVKEDHATQQLTYDEAYISIDFVGAGTSIDMYPTGDIVEGWQRIVGSFTIPSSTTDLDIALMNDNTSITAYFDDIRIHPFNASMKSYVYDPETFWLTAELDDNNYATFYEYDKEGQLIRIKKETERGIMTIQESRSNNPKTEE